MLAQCSMSNDAQPQYQGEVIGSGGGLVAKSCLTHGRRAVDSSVHGIFQARILEWNAISFSRGSSQPRN